jgi:hypothetical protein
MGTTHQLRPSKAPSDGCDPSIKAFDLIFERSTCWFGAVRPNNRRVDLEARQGAGEIGDELARFGDHGHGLLEPLNDQVQVQSRLGVGDGRRRGGYELLSRHN